MKTRDLAMAGLATAVVFVITRTLVVPIPQTKGFFNLGEAGIYAASLLFGPLVGALAGGVGSALADVSLGYAQYAPFTLVIKGLEGALVGLIARGVHRGLWLAGGAAGAIAAVWLLTLDAWPVRAAAGLLLLAVVAGAALQRRARDRALVARLGGMLCGGTVMVGGYFIVQAFVLGLGVATALVEVPYNVVQVVVGVVVGTAVSVAVAQGMTTAVR
jgi:uncharacterized membrane protein